MFYDFNYSISNFYPMNPIIIQIQDYTILQYKRGSLESLEK